MKNHQHDGEGSSDDNPFVAIGSVTVSGKSTTSL